MDEKRASLAFNLAKGISTSQFLSLIEAYGSCSMAANATATLQPLLDAAEKELKLAQTFGIDIIPYTAPDYPAQLKLLPDAPKVLYIMGKLPQPQVSLAIIGTRSATEWGKECARFFAEKMQECDIWVVSGLARGIDTAAHKGAMSKTMAIVGSGLLELYPKENQVLAEKIALSGGAIVSEFTLKAPPHRFNFPKRNRLIAAFSSALLLIEAPVKSGAMITMELGIKQKKQLFACPGRAMSDNYQGNHLLIKEGKAVLVESPEELVKLLGREVREIESSKNLKQTILDSEQKILDLLCQSELSIDELSHFTCLPIKNLQVTLTKLILKSLAVELPGKRYKGIGMHGKVINNR